MPRTPVPPPPSPGRRRGGWSDLLDLRLDPDAAMPLFRQLQQGLRAAIVERALPLGARLPSTRDLARRLGVSRASVVAAYEQLLSEGYVAGRIGAGTYVAVDVPREPRRAARARPGLARAMLSTRGRHVEATRPGPDDAPLALRPFATGAVHLDQRLRVAWRQAVLRHVAVLDDVHLQYGDRRGVPALRDAIAAYLRLSRAARGEGDGVLVTTGTQQSYDLVAKLLLEPGDRVWVEDPCYPALRAALEAHGATLCPVPVDAEGMDVPRAIRRHGTAKVVFVTPSHHYPTGARLSLARRMQLIEWAEASGAWIVEDDYDGGFRFAAEPLASLQGLDSADRVIYLGTFSKILFPGLRLGFLLAPPALTHALAQERRLTDQQVATPLQLVVAELLRDGHLASHIRRMGQRCQASRDALIAGLRRHLGDAVDVTPPEQGIQLLARLRGVRDDVALATRLAAKGVMTRPISPMYISARPEPGLLLGYAGYDEHAIRSAVLRMARVITGRH